MDSPDNSTNDGVGADRLTGRQIAHYRLDAVVARGEESVVYRATDLTLDRVVAIKMLSDASLGARLIEEARAISQLAHPGIAAVYHAGSDATIGYAFMASEWVEGETLRSRLARGPLDRREFTDLTVAIAAAVAHAHTRGLVHGDLKADNIVLPKGGDTIKLIDFGLSSAIEDFHEHDLWGTPAYMAPELFLGHERTVESDLFALGVLLYELATGELPYGGADGDENAVRRRQQDGLDRLIDVKGRLPSGTEDIIEGLLATDPAKRAPQADGVATWARGAGSIRPKRLRVVAVLLGAVALASFAWHFRSWYLPEDLIEEAEKPAAVEVALRPLRVGVWLDAQGNASDASRLLHDVIALHLQPEDPGTAVLLEAAALPDAVWIHGRIEPVGGGPGSRWRMRWQLSTAAEFDGDEAGTQMRERLVDRPAAGVGALVDALLNDEVIELAGDRRVRFGSRRSLTLTTRADGLERFVAGVRATSAHDFGAALQAFRRAQQGGAFLEAAAWEYATLAALGRLDEAARGVRELQGRLLDARIPKLELSRIGRVLLDTIGRPSSDRRGRWQVDHPLAKAFDRVLDSCDPQLTDRDVVARIEAYLDAEDAAPTSAEPADIGLALRAAELYLRLDDVASARRLLGRYRAGSSRDGWRYKWLEWQVDVGRQSPEQHQTQLAFWLLQNPDRPEYFLRMPLFLVRGDPAAALKIADKSADLFAAKVCQVATLAIGGEFDRALVLCGDLERPLDAGIGDRWRAAIAMLAGREELARSSLEHALERDPQHPETAFLIDYIAREDPYTVSSEALPESDFSRWRRRFSLLSEARKQRTAGDPDAARSLLAPYHLVSPTLSIHPWLELAYLGQLERIRCQIDVGDADAARAAIDEFRKGWPSSRPDSRVSREALAVEARLDGQ